MFSLVKNKFTEAQEKIDKSEEAKEAKEVTESLEHRELVFDLIRNIRDPEKPETLEDLNVVSEDLVEVEPKVNNPGKFIIKVIFVPTVPHCSLATLIGLCIRTKLQQELPEGIFKIDLSIKVKKTISFRFILLL